MHTVGIIGTGEIGWRMGKLLLAAGHEVIGYDIAPAALARPRESGFAIATGIADLCRRSQVVVTCVTDGAALRDAVEGPDGIAENLAPGRPLIDTTSAEPWIAREIATLLAAKGIPFLDAPVSGGVPAAEAGRMNFMVGGDAELLARCRPLLSRLGPVVTHVGATGSGHAVKAVNMLALATKMLAAAETVGIGRACGLELGLLVERLDRGPGASYSTRVHFPRFIVPGNYASGFTFDLMRKDLGIAVGLADRHDVPLLLGRTTWEYYRAAGNAGLAGQDNTRIVESLVAPAGDATAGPGEGLAELLGRLATMTNLLAAAEAVALGAAAGLEPGKTIEVLAASSGDSHALSRCLPAYLMGAGRRPTPIEREWRQGAEALRLGIDRRRPLFVTAQAVSLHAAAIARYGAAADRNRAVDLVLTWAGQDGRVLEERAREAKR